MSDLRRETTVGTVIAIVDDLTQDWGLERDAPSGAETMVAADLEFASVDIIQLCVALEQCYGRRFGFQDLLMKNGSYVGDLSLGQFAAFVDLKINSEGVAT
ncbi:MAG: acyl carrier protein [Burkholderiales bacterium]